MILGVMVGFIRAFDERQPGLFPFDHAALQVLDVGISFTHKDLLRDAASPAAVAIQYDGIILRDAPEFLCKTQLPSGSPLTFGMLDKGQDPVDFEGNQILLFSFEFGITLPAH